MPPRIERPPTQAPDRLDALAWLNVIAGGALDGDDDYRRLLPSAVSYFLRVRREVR